MTLTIVLMFTATAVMLVLVVNELRIIACRWLGKAGLMNRRHYPQPPFPRIINIRRWWDHR